jgi:hypothetical protein
MMWKGEKLILDASKRYVKVERRFNWLGVM